jgi:threonyl-tRNA synthetase
VKLSTRPEQRFGTDAMWDFAESKLAEILNDKGVVWEEQIGEGAFYGPKIEFSLKDCLGRVWQCGTLQLDPVLPERLGASYIAEDNERKIPYMLHRAIFGSLERFIGILLENYAGHLPIWLAPVQAVVLNITEKQADYAKQIAEKLQQNNFRVQTDLRNEKISYKIRSHSLEKVPFMLVIGDREMEQNLVAVRRQSGEDLGVMTAEAFAADYLALSPQETS